MNEEVLNYIKKWLSNNKFSILKYTNSERDYIQVHPEGWEIHYFFERLDYEEKSYSKNEFYLVSPSNKILIKYSCYNLTIAKVQRIHQIFNKWIPRK